MIPALLLILADAPKDAHRIAVEGIPITAPLGEVATCITREFNRVGKATQMQTGDGYIIDWAITSFFSSAGSAYVSAELKQGEPSLLTVKYRHPINSKAAQSMARGLGKRCYREDWNAWASANGQKPVE